MDFFICVDNGPIIWSPYRMDRLIFKSYLIPPNSLDFFFFFWLTKENGHIRVVTCSEPQHLNPIMHGVGYTWPILVQ